MHSAREQRELEENYDNPLTLLSNHNDEQIPVIKDVDEDEDDTLTAIDELYDRIRSWDAPSQRAQQQQSTSTLTQPVKQKNDDKPGYAKSPAPKTLQTSVRVADTVSPAGRQPSKPVSASRTAPTPLLALRGGDPSSHYQRHPPRNKGEYITVLPDPEPSHYADTLRRQQQPQSPQHSSHYATPARQNHNNNNDDDVADDVVDNDQLHWIDEETHPGILADTEA